MSALVLVVSPHLDDASISCGGTIAKLTRVAHVIVVTVFAGDPRGADPSPLVTELTATTGCLSEPATRRAEDDAALAVLGATPIHLPLADCIYRDDGYGGPRVQTWADVFGNVGAACDHDVRSTIERHLSALMTTLRPGFVLVPLGVGHHIDHQLARLAAESCLDSTPHAYYEDLPYAAESGLDASTAGVSHSHDVDVDQTWTVKLRSIAEYHSQLPILWPPPARWRSELERYAGALAGASLSERIWGAAADLEVVEQLTR